MSDIFTKTDQPVACAFALDGADAGQPLDAARVPDRLRADTLAWAHLNARAPQTPDWIVGNLSYLDAGIVDALVAEETRPRVTCVGEGLIVILRGINMNAGQDPEDMVSVRMWIDRHRIVSLSHAPVRAIDDIAKAVTSGDGPADAAAFLLQLTERLNFRIEDFWSGLEDQADTLEEEVLTDALPEDIRSRLIELRRRAIILRRYLQPQRDAMRMLQARYPDWLTPGDLRHLAEELDALERVVEDAEAMRERMALVRDELESRLSDRLNRNMYRLSILSALFLPLSFLTGLFGINVASIPGAATPGAFWIFSGALVVLVAVQMLILRRLSWI